MLQRLNELRQKKGELVKQMRDLHSRETEEKRSLSAEETEIWNRLDNEIDETNKKLEREEKLYQRSKELAEIPADQKVVERGTPAAQSQETADGKVVPLRARPEYRKAFEGYLRTGNKSGLETRDLQADSDAGGGYLLAPLEFVKDLIIFVNNEVFIRSLAKKLTVQGAESIGVPQLATDINDADWTAELAMGNDDTAMAFGRRDMRPHPLAKQIKVSKKLIRQAQLAPETLVMERMGYKFGVAQEKAFLLGNGAQQPLGLFVASANGIDSSRDFSTGNTTTTLGADAFIETKYQLKSQYWARPSTRWVMHRDVMRAARKLKDGEGQYLWQPGLTGGIPDRILETPFNISEYAPNTFTTGQYMALIGDMSFYWIVDSMDFEVQRLDELYAATNQVGFIGRMELDGAPVLAEPFARMKLA